MIGKTGIKIRTQWLVKELYCEILAVSNAIALNCTIGEAVASSKKCRWLT